jgi:hypothetical protein
MPRLQEEQSIVHSILKWQRQLKDTVRGATRNGVIAVWIPRGQDSPRRRTHTVLTVCVISFGTVVNASGETAWYSEFEVAARKRILYPNRNTLDIYHFVHPERATNATRWNPSDASSSDPLQVGCYLPSSRCQLSAL